MLQAWQNKVLSSSEKVECSSFAIKPIHFVTLKSLSHHVRTITNRFTIVDVLRVVHRLSIARYSSVELVPNLDGAWLEEAERGGGVEGDGEVIYDPGTE